MTIFDKLLCSQIWITHVVNNKDTWHQVISFEKQNECINFSFKPFFCSNRSRLWHSSVSNLPMCLPSHYWRNSFTGDVDRTWRPSSKESNVKSLTFLGLLWGLHKVRASSKLKTWLPGGGRLMAARKTLIIESKLCIVLPNNFKLLCVKSKLWANINCWRSFWRED